MILKNIKRTTLMMTGLLASLMLLTACSQKNDPTNVGDEDPEVTVIGLTLYSPLGMQNTYLVDENGSVVNSWESDYNPALSSYLLPDSTLLRTASVERLNGGTGGRIEQFDWDGNLIWEFDYRGDDYLLHHDIEYLPNGNILAIARKFKTSSEAIAAGRNPALIVDGELWPDMIVEIEPLAGNIVWEWHIWDHLIQDYDSAQANYGVVSDHPEKVDINFVTAHPASDWTHCNGVDYNADLDQIMVTVHNFSEIWIIDHSTTTAEASGPAGDLLYRWGNPQTYGYGSASDQYLFGPHDGRWINDDCPGAGDILIFNNGKNRPSGNFSSVEQITPPEDGLLGYEFGEGTAFGPSAANWTYVAASPTTFFADHISGAQRLPNGNTMICNGPAGYFFEVTDEGEVIWEYQNPHAEIGQVGSEVFRASRYYISN